MNRQKILIIAVVILVLFNITTLSLLWFSKPGKKYHRTMRKHAGVEHFLTQKLNLSDKQADAFKTMRETHFEHTHSILVELYEDRQSLSQMLSNTDTSMQNGLMLKISKKKAELERLNFQHLQKLRSICNDEQKQKFDSVIFKVIDRGAGFRKNKKYHKKRK